MGGLMGGLEKAAFWPAQARGDRRARIILILESGRFRFGKSIEGI
jgi:hypothetical protein